jgi:hypothetical protein
LIFTNQVIAQNLSLNSEKEVDLQKYFSQIIIEPTDIIKEELNSKIVNRFREILKDDESFSNEFDSLKNIGIVYSADEKVRLITWNLPYNDGTHKYFGFIQYKKSKRKVLTFELNDQSDKIKRPETTVLSSINWYGALYYKVIDNKYKGETYYTLLGADLNNMFTHKKIIEILSFGKDDIPFFGKAVFKNQKSANTRLIFEFAAQSTMVVTYDEDMQMIVYDHLSPSRPSLKGRFEFYGPDFSYDGLKFERGIWNRYQEIDVRNYDLD